MLAIGRRINLSEYRCQKMFSTAAVRFVVQPAEPRQRESFASGGPKALPVLLGPFLRRGLPRLLGMLLYLLESLLELLGRVRVPKRPCQFLQALFVGTYENERLSERHFLEGGQR